MEDVGGVGLVDITEGRATLAVLPANGVELLPGDSGVVGLEGDSTGLFVVGGLVDVVVDGPSVLRETGTHVSEVAVGVVEEGFVVGEVGRVVGLVVVGGLVVGFGFGFGLLAVGFGGGFCVGLGF